MYQDQEEEDFYVDIFAGCCVYDDVIEDLDDPMVDSHDLDDSGDDWWFKDPYWNEIYDMNSQCEFDLFLAQQEATRDVEEEHFLHLETQPPRHHHKRNRRGLRRRNLWSRPQ